MKYGLVYYKKSVNIGDAIQTYAIQCLYEELNIDKSDMIKIAVEDFSTYVGEYVLLPMNTFSHVETLHLSDYIIPLYIGYNNTLYLNDEEVNLLKKYEPIGCRDEYTMKNLRSFGIQCFLTGCFTLTLPKRTQKNSRRKIFFIDTPQNLINYVPDDMKQDVVFLSHIVEDRNSHLYNTPEQFHNFAIQRLKLYAEEADLIVTGRLHCASPCLALGIPVIIVKQNIDVNLSWIDKFLPIYTEETFSKINWHPDSVDLEEHKTHMKELFKFSLGKMSSYYKQYADLSYYYETRKKSDYNFKLTRKLKSIVKMLRKDNFSYAIWGCGPGGMLAYQLVKNHYQNTKLCFAIDRFKQGMFFGVPIFAPDQIPAISVDIILICTYSGRIDAVETLEKLNKIVDKNYTFFLSKDNCQDKYFTGYDDLDERI